MSGSSIVSYYLGTMLSNVGITNATTQLQINIYISLFSLVCSILGTWSVDHIGRKALALSSTILLTVSFFLIGGLTKRYGESDNQSAISATVAMIFIFSGANAFGWVPLTVLYSVEVLNYSIRANGLAVYNTVQSALGLMIVFAGPTALASLGWILYIMNASWDVLELIFIAIFWVETKDKTLEEIDIIFDGQLHSDVQQLKVVEGKGGDIDDSIGNMISSSDLAKANKETEAAIVTSGRPSSFSAA